MFTNKNAAELYTVELSIAQHRLFGDVIKDRKACGDCRLYGLMLQFDDYEGASATLRAVMAVKTNTTREYVTWNSVVGRINALIRKQFGGEHHVAH